MKKLFTILISALILTNAIFCANPQIPEGETDNVKDKLELPGDDFTYTFDITNESDKKVSFYVYSEWSDTKDPDVFYEIKVPAKSKNVYTYTVSKDMYDKYSFGYVYKDEKEGVGLMGGKSQFYDDAWMVVNEDLTFQYEYFGKITTYYLGKVDTFRLKMSTFSGNWQKFKKEQEKWEKERKRHGIINDFAASKKIQLEEASKQQLFESEKALVGKWQGTYQGLKTTLTLNKNKTYRLDFEGGAWEQWWWNADPSYINLQIYTTKEILTIPYTLKDNILSTGNMGEWKRVQ